MMSNPIFAQQIPRHFKAVLHKSKPSGVIEIIVIIKTVVACIVGRININQFYFSH
jgi:hypothetical protein